MDRADIQYAVVPTLHAVLRAQGIDVAAASAQSIVVDVDGEYRIEQARNYTLCVDGSAVSCAQDIQLQENARIDFAWIDGAITLGTLVSSYPTSGRDMRVRINGQDYLFPGGQGKILVNGQEAALDTLLRTGDSVRTVPGKDAEAVLVDVFRYITVNPQDQAGKRMKLLINGQESQYTSVLNDNADVSVMFE
jgi:hypothetical protein